MGLHRGDICRIAIDLEGAKLDKAQKISARVRNGSNEFYFENVEFWFLSESEKAGDGGINILIDENISWKLKENTALSIQIKINYMHDKNNDGVYADDIDSTYGTRTIDCGSIMVLPTEFVAGDVKECKENVGEN